MVAAREVRRRAAQVLREYGTNDPFALAREMHIEILVRELGTLKGFYKDVYGAPFIFLSRRLTRGEARLVCAHELGHHLLHRQFAAFGFEEVSVFSPASRREYEANLFAAELLLDTREIFDAARAGRTAGEIAAECGADVRLVELKLSSMGLSKK